MGWEHDGPRAGFPLLSRTDATPRGTSERRHRRRSPSQLVHARVADRHHKPLQVDASTAKVVARIGFTELIVVDDIGLLPAGEDEAEALYRLIDAAYGRRSLILTSNLHPGRFDTIFPKGLATTAVDRWPPADRGPRPALPVRTCVRPTPDSRHTAIGRPARFGMPDRRRQPAPPAHQPTENERQDGSPTPGLSQV